jgi:hypothetical protein
MERDNVLNKIRHLLNKTTANGASEAEAQTAMAMAQRLLDEHNLSMAEVAGPVGTDGDGYQSSVAWESDTLHSQYAFVMVVVDRAFAVRSIVRRYKSGSRTTAVKIVVFGDPVNVEAATWALKYLAGTFRSLWDRYRARTGARTDLMVGYYGGLQVGLLQRLDAERQSHLAELPGGSANALVLVRDRLEQAFAAAYPNVKALVKRGNQDAFADGVADSRDVSLNRPLAEGQRRQITA